MKTRIFILLAALILLAVSAVQAQDTAAGWEAWFYDQVQLQVVQPGGVVEVVPLPDEAQNVDALTSVALSPDHRYFVFAVPAGDASTTGTPLLQLMIADLEAETCCTAVPAPLDGEYDTIITGVFNPDNTEFAASFSRVYSGDLVQAFVTIDAASGQITRMMPPQDFTDAAALTQSWTAEGILYFPSCWACGGAIEGMYSLWEPVTNVVTRDVEYFNALADTLPLTGESLLAATDAAYPSSDQAAMIGPFNVIQYSTELTPDGGEVIYHRADMLNLSGPKWVADGNAYLITDWTSGVERLVFRDGRTVDVSMEDGEQFLVGTPDGWITRSFSDGGWYAYEVSFGEVNIMSMGFTNQLFKLVSAPVLGASASGGMLPVIAQ